MSARTWQAVLLLPMPPLVFAYLLLVRSELVGANFAPVVIAGLAPLYSLLVGTLRVRPWATGLLLLAVLELAGAVLAAALVGFAIAARSG